MRCAWKTLLSATLLAAAATQARPIVIEESAVIASPDPAIYPDFGFEVATNGEEALIAGFDDVTDYEVLQYYALLYRKVNGQWTFQRVFHHVEHYYDSYYYPVQFAMRGDLVIAALGGAPHAWRRTGGSWQALGRLGDLSEDVELTISSRRRFLSTSVPAPGPGTCT